MEHWDPKHVELTNVMNKINLKTLFILLDYIPHFSDHNTHRTIRRTMIFSFLILEKNNDERILILVIYWKVTGLEYAKISNHNIIYSS